MITNYYSKYNPKILFRLLLNKMLVPVKALNAQLSVITSANDDNSTANKRLLDIAAAAITRTAGIDLREIAKREKDGNRYMEVFPGEHYTLLAALITVLQPKVVVEIGTYLGQASLVIRSFLPEGGTLHTFDIIPWNEFRDTCFLPEDFTDGRLVQHTDDLTIPAVLQKHKALLESADFIFLDALKDGIQEKKFIENFEQIQLKKDCLIMFDDTRVWNMIKIWRDISRPKLDLTSFGHWSGTGLVDWHG